jgi:hypothetical protein
MSVHHDRLIRSMLASLEPGCPVVTADGEQVGILQEVSEETTSAAAMGAASNCRSSGRTSMPTNWTLPALLTSPSPTTR